MKVGKLTSGRLLENTSSESSLNVRRLTFLDKVQENYEHIYIIIKKNRLIPLLNLPETPPLHVELTG